MSLNVMSLGVDTAELREEILEILARSDAPADARNIHAQSGISPGIATTAGELGRLVKAGMVRRVLNPVSSKALYRLEEPVAPASQAEVHAKPTPTPQPTAVDELADVATAAEKPEPSLRARSLKAQVSDCLAVTTQALTTREIAAALGDDDPSATRIRAVSGALARLADEGLIERERIGSGHGLRCRWRWIGVAAPQAKCTQPASPLPAPAPAPIPAPIPSAPVPANPTPAPAAASVEWSLTRQGTLVLRRGGAAIELSARESLALRCFIGAVDMLAIQESRP